MIIAQQAAQPLAALNRSVAADVGTPGKQQDIALPLVIAFGMVMLDIYIQRPPQRALAEQPVASVMRTRPMSRRVWHVAAGCWKATGRGANQRIRRSGQRARDRSMVAPASVRHRGLRVRRIGRVLLDAADEVERGMQRLVVFRVRRDVGLRAGLLVAFGLE